jgi:large subunit ribosomal protein L10
MKKELSEMLTTNRNFYITDISKLTSNQTNGLRRLCFSKGITLQVVKNSLIEKAMGQANIENAEFAQVLRGPSAIMLAENSTAPAKLIKEFRGKDKSPVLKAAYIEDSLYVGDDLLDTLITLKSKEELIADVIALLQSPIKNVISGLKASSGEKIAGLVKTLSEKES